MTQEVIKYHKMFDQLGEICYICYTGDMMDM